MIILITLLRLIVLCWINRKNNTILAKIDVNVAELEYLAAHLSPFECRRLVAALHYTTFELPKSLDVVERNINDGIPCVEQLHHWSKSVGRGQTQEVLGHRLRQLNKNELADWLSKKTFWQLGRNLEKSINLPFEEQTTESIHSTTIESTDEPHDNETDYNDDDDLWFSIDIILWPLLIGLSITTILLILTIIARKCLA